MKKILGLAALLISTNYSCLTPERIFKNADSQQRGTSQTDSTSTTDEPYQVLLPYSQKQVRQSAYDIHHQEPLRVRDMKNNYLP